MKPAQLAILFVGLIVGVGIVAGQGMMGGGAAVPGTMQPGMMQPGMMQPGAMHPGMMHPGSMCAAGMMGPGAMSRMGRMPGMGRMSGMGMGRMQVWPASAVPLTDDELRVRLEGAVSSVAGDARLGHVMPFANHTYAQVVDAEGNGIAEILVDRYTGVVHPEPGPNMMWNPAGMMGRGVQAFPGYVTFDYERDGRILGMLSVHDATGLVWPHGWHGAYLGDDGHEP